MVLNNIIGEYYLVGIPEMAAGFKFDNDYNFQFFYTYGASDRHAHGKFEIHDNKLILHGTKLLGHDFNLLQKSKTDKGYTVQISHNNQFFIKNIVCIFFGINETVTEETNQKGIATAEINKCSKIELIHSYFPDLPTVVKLDNDESNCFEFTLNPSLEEVVFIDTEINFENEKLKYSNIYLFGQNTAQFIKNQLVKD